MPDDGSQFLRIPRRLRSWEELNRRVSDLSANTLRRIEDMDEAVGDYDSPTLISGTPILMRGGPLFVRLGEALQEDHYVLIGESVDIDGEDYSPLFVGPRYVPQITESFTESTDHDLSAPAVVLPGSTLANAYAANDTTVTYDVTLTEESSNRSSTITIELWANLAAQGSTWAVYATDVYPMAANTRIDVTNSYPINVGLAVGDQIELRVSAVLSHQQAQPFVRGSLRVSRIEANQG